MDIERLTIGVIGALVGVIGWLLVGLYIQRRAEDRQSREAARAVYFELAANHLNVFVALDYGVFGTLSRTTFDRLLPEVAAWIPIEELQAISVAYLGHAGYEQMRDGSIPLDVRRQSLRALHEAHKTAVALLRRRAFTATEITRLAAHLRPDQIRLMEAADATPGQAPHSQTEVTRARA